MELRIFQSAQGDCLLLSSSDGHHVLCDGGMAGSMRDYVRDELSQLDALDYVYVSHIDSDHISGVLQLLQDAVEWRVHAYHQAAGNKVRAPKVPKPPRINGLLHNAFRDQIGKTQHEVAELLDAAVPALFATSVPQALAIATGLEKIAASIPEALKVSRLAAPDALGIPVNQPTGAPAPLPLLHAGQPCDTFDVGSMQFRLVGPTPEELADLGKGWLTWLRANKDSVQRIRAELKRRIDSFSAGREAGAPFDLRHWNGVADYKGVTAPNVASLMYLVTEGPRTLLLTGDAQQDFILKGLRRIGLLGHKGVLLDVLKVQHHGSENNLDAEFAHQVCARHYVFCGNGASGNPEPAVIDTLMHSRLSPDPKVRALAEDGQEFTFWFSTTSAAQESGSDEREAFAALERRVKHWQAKASGRLKVRYNTGASLALCL